MLIQSLRMTWRDWRAGELRFMLVALVVAVSAIAAVGFFVDRLRSGLERDAHQLLGADVLINADAPVSTQWREQARREGLLLADTVTFPSMAQAGEGEASRAVLMSVKAVSAAYPLRGKLKITVDPQQARAGAGRTADMAPAPGTVWVDANVLTALRVSVGETIRLGEQQLRITQLIGSEPDRGAAFANLAPRVMFSIDDLEATGLIARGSRVTYRLQVAAPPGLPPANLVRFTRYLEQAINGADVKGVRVETLESGRPEMRATLDRAGRFLSLVGQLSCILAAVAIAMAARRFMLRHLDACAMMRCLGLSQAQATALYLFEFLIVGLCGSALGVLAGFAAHFVLLGVLGPLIGADLPAPTLLPAVQGLATGLLLLVGFALPPVLQLRNVPHNRVIRREQGAPGTAVLGTYGMGLAAFLTLLLWQTGDTRLTIITALGFLVGFGVFALVGWLSLRALKLLRGALALQSWRFAVTSLQRRPGATLVQIVSLALGLMALLLLTVVRGDLIGAWRSATPPDAPNRFIINIMPEQKADVERELARAQVRGAELYPMIRGRLTAVNGTPVTAATYQDENARRMAEREFNLSTMTQLPAANRVTSGRWYVDTPGPVGEASVEEGIAKTLGLTLGDRLRFDVGGQPVEASVTSLRKLEWGSMRVNFFIIINPSAVQGAASTLITAFHVSDEQTGLTEQLTRVFPNLSVIDVGGILKQIQDVLNKVVTAVEFLFLFTLASGVLVLYAALMGSNDERTREAALLRALGATRGQLARAQAIEFALVGALAGLLAATGASALGWALATFQFEFAWRFTPQVWLAGVAGGMLCALVGGQVGLRGVLNTPPLQTLRAG